jgi:integrase
VPISAALRAVLAACPRSAAPYVFASAVSTGPMSGWTQLIGKLCAASGVDFTLHDLRRTFRTGLTNLGADHDLGELALGHQRDDLTRRYDKSLRWTYRVRLADQWAEHVAALVVGSRAVLAIRITRLFQ